VDADKQPVHIPNPSGTLASSQGESFQLKKWGGAEKAGFQLVPNVIFQAQRRLGLDSGDVVILLNLTLHWWSADRLPFPSPAIIANRTGLSKRTVERRIKALEKKEFLKRLSAEANEGGPPRRKYQLDGFIEKLQTVAAIGLNQREFVKKRRKAEGQKHEKARG